MRHDVLQTGDGQGGPVGDPPVERVLRRLGGRRGLVDGALPPVAFVAAYAVVGHAVSAADALRWSTVAALATGATLLVSRLVGGDPLGPALRGMAGLVVAVAFAALSGDARDFFLPGIYVDAGYAVAFAGSVAVGHPVVGHGYAMVLGYDGDWRRDLRLRRLFVRATLGWSAVSALRAGVQWGLYRADATEMLAVAKLVLGWPLTVGAVLLTVRAVRRVGAGAGGRRSHSATTADGQRLPPPSYHDPQGVGHVRRTPMYTAHDLAELGERLAEDGPECHERALQEIASAVADRSPGAAAALQDTTATDVLRQRAFSVAASTLLAPHPSPLQPAA